MDRGLWSVFSAAVQGSISVLFTILWGGLAGYLDILDDHSTQRVSRLCVTLLLPALMVTHIGSELSPDNVVRYAAIVAWSLIYTASTLALSLWLQKLLRLPSWTVVATTFNSNTSMPLLLIQSLAATGIIDDLLISDSDTVGAAVDRAKSYFLANALCANVLTFVIGPKILQRPPARQGREQEAFGDDDDDDDAEQWQPEPGEVLSPTNEAMSLLRSPLPAHRTSAPDQPRSISRQTLRRLPTWFQAPCEFLYSLVDPVLAGGIVAAILGLVPPLHRAFFNSSRDGGVFNAWFMTSIETVGEIFVALQILVVGVRLSECLRKMQRGESTSRMPWPGAISTLIIRYVMWPLVSIAFIRFIYTRTSVLSGDPMLPFTMMLMPCGPSAMKLAALADIAGSSDDKMSLAMFLTLSYVLSPALALAVIGSFKSTQGFVS